MATDCATLCPDASFKYLEVSTGGLVVSLQGEEVHLCRKDYKLKGQRWRSKNNYIECFDGRVLGVKGDGGDYHAAGTQVVACARQLEAEQSPDQCWTLEADGHLKNGSQCENWLFQMCDLFLAVRDDQGDIEEGNELCISEKAEGEGQRWKFTDVPEDVAARKQKKDEEAAAQRRQQEAAAEAAAKKKKEESEDLEIGRSGSSSDPRRRGGSKVDPMAQDDHDDHFDECDKKNLIGGDTKDSSCVGMMPSSLKWTLPDGSVSKIILSKPGGKMCLGLPPPPGGWYGPFGFLRLIAYAFVGWGCFGILGFLYAVRDGQVWLAIASVLLVVAGFFSALAAEAHEGLAKQVSQVAKQNEKFAKKNVKLARQIDELQKTEERLSKTAEVMSGDVDQLIDVIAQLNKVKNLEQVNTMIAAFLDAERNSGHLDLCLNGEEELNDFWSGCRAVVKKELPSFDLDELHEKSLETGLPFICISLIISAVLRNCSGHPHEVRHSSKNHQKHQCYEERAAKTFLNTVLFALDPQEETRIEALEKDLESVLPLLPDYAPNETLHNFLLGLAENAAAVKVGAKVVPNERLKDFARALTGISPWPAPDGSMIPTSSGTETVSTAPSSVFGRPSAYAQASC